MQGLPGPPGLNGLTYIRNTISFPFNFLLPFAATSCTIGKNTIYLNGPSSYYAIDVSINSLGDAYIPNQDNHVNGIGSWDVNNILAGTPGNSPGSMINVFDMSQRPVMFFIQNIGGVPIQVNFAIDNSNQSLAYLSFGAPPNQTPSSFILQPLDILIFQTVFTSNNVVRFYNSFLDSLNYKQLFRTFDQALAQGYYSDTNTLANSTVGTTSIPNLIAVIASSQLILSETYQYFSENNIIFFSMNQPLELVIDGTDLPSNAVFLLLLATPFNYYSSLVTLKNLVGSRNYNGELPPKQLSPNQIWYFLVKGTTVMAYDQPHVNFSKEAKYEATNIGLYSL